MIKLFYKTLTIDLHVHVLASKFTHKKKKKECYNAVVLFIIPQDILHVNILSKIT